MPIPTPKYGDIVTPGQQGVAVYDPNTGALLPGAGSYNPNTGAKIQQTPINASIIGNTSQLNLPPAPTTPNYNSTLAGMNASVGAPTGGLIPQAPTATSDQTKVQPTTAPVKSLADTVKEMLGLTKAPINQSEIYAKAEADAGIQAKQQQVNTLTNQLNAITAQNQADQLQLTGQGRGITTGIIRGQQAELSKQAAIQSLPIAAQLSAAQGDLQTAQQHLDSYFKIVTADAQAQNDYYNQAVSTAYDLFSKEEQRQLDATKEQKATDVATMRDAVNYAQTLASQALANGDNATLKAITSLQTPDPTAPTFQADLQQYNQQVATYAGSMKADPATALDLQLKKAQIASANRANQPSVDTQVVDVNGKKLLINTKTGQTIRELSPTDSGSSVQQTAQAQSNINLIDTLKTSGGLSGAVGSIIFSRSGGGLDALNGTKQDFIAGVQQLTSQLTLDSLINAKAKGATFGALSEGELNILAGSASKLNTWAIKDGKGNVTGYKASEKSFKQELDKISNFAKLDYILKGGTPASIGLQTMPDGSIWSANSDGSFTQIK